MTWLIAIAGGLIGALFTTLVGAVAFVVAARRQIESDDRFVADRDEDLQSWVADRSVALAREITATTEDMNKRNLFYSGAHALALGRLKEQALHEWRDEARQARRDVAAVAGSERAAHRYWRRRRGTPFPSLSAPEAADVVLQEWRSPVTRHGEVYEIDDPSVRDLASVRRLGINQFT